MRYAPDGMLEASYYRVSIDLAPGIRLGASLPILLIGAGTCPWALQGPARRAFCL